MKYLSLFSGIEAASCAWQPLGWELAGVCEIEKFPCNVLKHHYPQVPNLGDITKVTKAQLEALGSIDLIVGGSPCFTADTLVTTDHGPVPICDIKVGDIVLTHKGRWQRVLRIGHKQAETIYVKGQGATLHCTRNHPIWARTSNRQWKDGTWTRIYGEMQWVSAEDLDHKYWGALTKSDSLEIPQPRLTGNATVTFDPYDLNVLELAGRYLADGDVHIFGGNDGERHGNIRISCGEYRRAVMDNLKQRVPFSCTEIKERTSIRYQFHGKSLAKWIEHNFGRGAENKYIPSWVYGLNTSQKAALLKGYLDGDGHRKPTHWKCSTISKKLAVGIKMLAEHLDVSVSISYIKKEPTYVIEGRTVNQHSYWELSIYDKPRSSFELDGWRWGLVRKIIPGEVETVYNLEVETDNSYIADGICSHNCQGFSVAGKQEGLNDIRSKLAVDYLRVINTVKPRWIVWENVPGVFSTNKGLDFRLFTEVLTQLRYGLCWRVLDAQWFGVSQRRRRVFLVGYLGDWRPAYKVLFESESLPRYLATLERTKERLTSGVKGSSGETGTRIDTLNPWDPQGKRVQSAEGKSPCLSASADADGNTIPLIMDKSTCYDMNHPCDVIRTYDDGKTPTLEARMGTGKNNIPLVFGEGSFYQYKEVTAGSTLKAVGGALGGGSENFVIGMNHIAEKAESVVVDKMTTLAARQYKSPPIVMDTRCYDRKHTADVIREYKELAPTITATVSKDPPIVTDRHAVATQARVRKLTPTECLRLQGFPDDWFKDVEGYSDTAAYKAIGNSMAVPCMKWIGERIALIDKEYNHA